MRYRIEKNTVQETLVIPLLGRLVCSERYPELFSDPEAERICDSLEYDFAEKRKKMETPAGLFGALEVAQRQYDLRCEAEAYLKDHPDAAVVNLGCGLDDTFRKCDNGRCRGYNVDLPDVIQVRNELLPASGRETNLAADLNDHAWMDRIDAPDGAVFLAAGVFYYFRTGDVKKLFAAMAEKFPGAVLAFDSCNRRGAKLMRKTWLKEAGMRCFGAACVLNGVTLIAALAAGEGDLPLIAGLIVLALLAELVRGLNGYGTRKGVRRSFVPLAFSFYAYSAHWWTDTEGSLAAAAEEMPAGYAGKMETVIGNVPLLIVMLVLTVPVAILAMRLAEKALKKQAASLK